MKQSEMLMGLLGSLLGEGKITFTDSLEIEITGSDADLLLDRCELIMRATDQFLANLQAAGEVN